MPNPRRIPGPSRLFVLALAALVFAGCEDLESLPGHLGAAGSGVGATDQAITAQPDPSCTHAQFGTHDYWLCSAAKNWQAAQNICAGVGMNLTRIDSAAENDFVRARIGSDSWIGARDTQQEGAWRWVEGNAQFWQGKRPGTVVGGLYNAWSPVEPNDLLGEDCGILRSSGEWNDINCTLTRAFVCESGAATGGQPQAPDTACTRTTYNGTEYWSCSNARSWTEAQQRCQSVGHDLVSIDDSAESTFVKGLITRDVHIGLTDRVRESVWLSTHTNRVGYCGGGGGGAPYGSFANWAAGEPLQSASACRMVTSGSKTYWACDQTVSWQAARDTCKAAGMQLARMDDAQENALVRTIIARPSYLGGSDFALQGAWSWLDGARFWSGTNTGSAVGGRYTNWHAGEPNSMPFEDCLSLELDGTWNDTLCEIPFLGSGFVCEGDADSQLPDDNDCAYAQLGSSSTTKGQWKAAPCSAQRAYICEAVKPAARATLEELTKSIVENHEAGASPITSLEFEPTATVTEPFLGFEDRMGLRACTDTLEPLGSPRPVAHLGLEQVSYVQKYKGVRVNNRGYSVLRHPTTKRVVSVMGAFEPDLAIDTTPVLTQAQALQRAAAAVGTAPSAYSPAPAGQLQILPTTLGNKRAHTLAWTFVLRRPNQEGFHVGVSAKDGAVVLLTRERKRFCPGSALPQPWVATDLNVHAFQQTGLFPPDPSVALAVLPATGATLPYFLYSKGLSRDAQSPLLNKPTIAMLCGYEEQPPGVHLVQRPVVMTVPSSPVTVGFPTPSSEGFAAGYFLAAQTALKTIANTFYAVRPVPATPTSPAVPGTPWIGLDGTGTQPVELRLMSGIDTPFAWDPLSGSILLDLGAEGSDHRGASIDIIAHELTHGIVKHVRGSTEIEPLDAASVEEGFADIIAATVEMEARNGNTAGLYCVGGDIHGNAPEKCFRNMQYPGQSQAEDTPPRTYKGPLWCRHGVECVPNGPSDCCDAHTNATVFDHWFFLATQGDTGVSESLCSYSVAPLSSDKRTAANMAAQIAFQALLDKRTAPAMDYGVMAQSMVEAAAKLYPPSASPPPPPAVPPPSVADRVRDAWHAVGVLDAWTPDQDGQLHPAPGATNVDPWGPFIWPVGPGETAWDMQIGIGDFAPGNLVYENRDPITTTIWPDNKRAYHHVALQERSDRKFVWRIRPHDRTRAPWRDCYRVHSFKGTRAITAPDIWFEGTDANGRIQPGDAYVDFHPIVGAVEYKVQLTPRPDLACKSEAGVPEEIVPALEGETSTRVVWFPNVLPNTRYYAYVQAFGPRETAAAATIGPCTVASIDTGDLPAPSLISPSYDARYDLYSPHVRDPSFWGSKDTLAWTWSGRPGSTSYRLTFYERDAAGACSAQPVVTKTVDASECANGTLCTLSGDLFPTPVPTGYCWNVVALSRTGDGTMVESPPSSTWRWGYFVEMKGRTPGEYMGNLTAILPGDSWGQAVVPFSWQQVPTALGYDFRLWRHMAGNWHIPGVNPIVYEERIVGGHIFRKEVPGAGPEIPGSTPKLFYGAAQGRYCWEITPLIEDPRTPGQPVAQAALKIIGGGPRCYTSGPSKPRIVIDVPEEQPYEHGVAEVRGHVEFDYVPDLQETHEANSSRVQYLPMQGCVAQTNGFRDIVGCRRDFVVTSPQYGEELSITIKTYNAPHPTSGEPVDQRANDGSYLVHSETFDLTAKKCGRPRDECCVHSDPCIGHTQECWYEEPRVCVECGTWGSPCCGPDKGRPECINDLVCDARGVCTNKCGKRGYPCCPGDKCDPGGTCNEDKVCESSCDTAGDPCCPNRECDGKLSCNASNRCERCGGNGQLCCRDDLCDGALLCHEGRCSECGGEGQPCCADGCDGGLACTSGSCRKPPAGSPKWQFVRTDNGGPYPWCTLFFDTDNWPDIIIRNVGTGPGPAVIHYSWRSCIGGVPLNFIPAHDCGILEVGEECVFFVNSSGSSEFVLWVNGIAEVERNCICNF